jgi:hypothetical protein
MHTKVYPPTHPLTSPPLPNPPHLLTLHRHNLHTLPPDLLPHIPPRLHIHRPRSLLDDTCAESLGTRMQRRCLDAVIRRQTHDVHVTHAPLPQLLGQPAVTDARVRQGRVEGRVHLDVWELALLDDGIEGADVEFWHEGRAGRVLDAVVGPEAGGVGLRRVVGVGDGGVVGEGLFAGVLGCEGDVCRWVPVLGCDLDCEGEGEEFVDGGDDSAPAGDGEGAVLWGCG